MTNDAETEENPIRAGSTRRQKIIAILEVMAIFTTGQLVVCVLARRSIASHISGLSPGHEDGRITPVDHRGRSRVCGVRRRLCLPAESDTHCGADRIPRRAGVDRDRSQAGRVGATGGRRWLIGGERGHRRGRRHCGPTDVLLRGRRRLSAGARARARPARSSFLASI